MMTERTSETIVEFSAAFALTGLDGRQPAGRYRVEHDEELMQTLSQTAWRRVGTYIHLPAIGAKSASYQMLPIQLADLEAALEADRTQSNAQTERAAQ